MQKRGGEGGKGNREGGREIGREGSREGGRDRFFHFGIFEGRREVGRGDLVD